MEDIWQPAKLNYGKPLMWLKMKHIVTSFLPHYSGGLVAWNSISFPLTGQVQQQTTNQGMLAKYYAVQQAKYKLSNAKEHLEVNIVE